MAEFKGEGVPGWAALGYDLVLSRSRHKRAGDLRVRLARRTFAEVGPGCWFSHSVKVVDPSGIRVGPRSLFSNSTILQGTGGLTFGRDCLIGFENVFLTHTHRYADVSVPVRDQGYYQAPIVLGDDVWTGCRVTVLPGVSIGSHTIVAAGSVVSRDLPAGVIAGGVPARVIKDR